MKCSRCSSFSQTFMVFGCEHNIFGSRRGKNVNPLYRIKEFSVELGCKVCVGEARWIILLHKVHIRREFPALPVPPVGKTKLLSTINHKKHCHESDQPFNFLIKENKTCFLERFGLFAFQISFLKLRLCTV